MEGRESSSVPIDSRFRSLAESPAAAQACDQAGLVGQGGAGGRRHTLYDAAYHSGCTHAGTLYTSPQHAFQGKLGVLYAVATLAAEAEVLARPLYPRSAHRP